MDDKFISDSITNMLRTETSTTYKNIDTRMLHAMLGIADEAGEFIEMILRATFYNQRIDMDHYKEELGDLWWCLCLAVDDLAEKENKTAIEMFYEILAINKAKLEARYPDGYSNEKANIRNLQKEKCAIHSAANITNTESNHDKDKS